MNDKPKNFFQGKKVLITVGPTREYWDSVRFFSNGSSGKMGLALARRFQSYGAKVFLVCGPGISPPAGFRFSSVVSARQMLKEVQKRFPRSDFFVSCAAVADYRPLRSAAKKVPKDKNSIQISLAKNPDILRAVAKKKSNRFCVGFALEDQDGFNKAARKMKEKKCDLMVLNGPDSMESDFIDAAILFPDGQSWRLGKISKTDCSKKICQAIVHSALAKPQ